MFFFCLVFAMPLYASVKGRPGLVRPRGMFSMWLYLACKLGYGAGKHIWKLLVTSLST